MTNGIQYRGRMTPKQIVAANLGRLMKWAELRGELGLASQNGLAKVAKVGQRTIGRILSLEQEPGVDTLHAIAQAYDLQGWQLLIPDIEPANPPVLKGASDAERELFKAFQDVQAKMRALEKEKASASQETASQSASPNHHQPRAKSRQKVAKPAK